MSENLRQKAKKLAVRPYWVMIRIDASEPDEPLYVALNPELEGCMAQGETVEDAKKNLDEFRVDYIEHLLEHNLPVPAPAGVTASTDSSLGKTTNVTWDLNLSSPDEGADKDVQSDNLKHVTAKRA